MTEPHEQKTKTTIAQTAAATVTSMIALMACARLAGPPLIYHRWHRDVPPTLWNLASRTRAQFRASAQKRKHKRTKFCVCKVCATHSNYLSWFNCLLLPSLVARLEVEASRFPPGSVRYFLLNWSTVSEAARPCFNRFDLDAGSSALTIGRRRHRNGSQRTGCKTYDVEPHISNAERSCRALSWSGVSRYPSQLAVPRIGPTFVTVGKSVLYPLPGHRQLKETPWRRRAIFLSSGFRRWRLQWRSRSKPQRLALARRGGGQQW